MTFYVPYYEPVRLPKRHATTSPLIHSTGEWR